MKNSLVLFLWVFGVSLTVEDIHQMPPNSWLEIPNTKMRPVTPKSGQFPGIWGVEGPSAVIDDWNGAALDTKRNRLICFGGGHSGYFGNELYAFDINSLSWSRLNDPTINPSLGSDKNWDNTPRDRHTYNTPAYIDHSDAFFVRGGPLMLGSNWVSEKYSWAFQFGSMKWSDLAAPGPQPFSWSGSWAKYDAVTKNLWYGEGFNSSPSSRWGLYKLDMEKNVWTRPFGNYIGGRTPSLDTKRGLVITIGQPLDVINVRDTNVVLQKWTTQGSAAVRKHGGFDYDLQADRHVAWDGGNAVFVFNPDTRAWSTKTAAGGPTRNGTGTFSRWKYVAAVNAFVSVNDIDQNVFFYKHTAGSGTGVKPQKSPGVFSAKLKVFPNPFRGVVSFRLRAASPGKTEFSVFDSQGKLVKNLASENREPVAHWAPWHRAPGVYFVRVHKDGKAFQKKVSLLN